MQKVIFAKDADLDGSYFTRMGTPVRVVEKLKNERVKVAYECPGYGIGVTGVRPHEIFLTQRPKN